jgi:hypothetical protein
LKSLIIGRIFALQWTLREKDNIIYIASLRRKTSS